MQILTDNPVVYSNASGARSWTKSKKRRKGWNKAAGFIPQVAVARAIQNRRDNTRSQGRRPNPIGAKPKGPKGKPAKQSVTNNVLPLKKTATMPPKKMSKSIKIVLISGAVIAAVVIGYLVIKKSK